MKANVLNNIKNHLEASESNVYHVRVHMMAFESMDVLEDYPERIVSIPMAEMEIERVEDSVLNGAFKYGQNDFQPKAGMRSVSVGDVVEVASPHSNEKYYARVAPMGFVDMNRAEVNEWADMDDHEKFMNGYKR